MTNDSIRFAWRPMAALTLVLISSFDNSVAAVTAQKYIRNARNLISSNCTNFRPPDAHYVNKLDLFYAYTVEFESSETTTKSLAGLALAVSSVVVELLADECDSMDRPMFKVKSDASHYVAQDEVCLPETMGNPCYVVNGVTTILLDKRSAHIQQRVYDAIALGLENSRLIKGFAPGVVRAEFQRSLGELLTPNPSSDIEDSTSAVPVAATIVVAAASVSIILGSMFWYSLMRRDRRLHPNPNSRYKSRGYIARSLMVVHGLGLDPHRINRRFSRLNDFSHDSELTDMNAFKNDTDDPGQLHHDATPSIIWSVSDITSDSGSVLSSTSVTGRRLEPIDEEGEENVDEGDESRERKCLSRQRQEHVLGIQHDRLVEDEHFAIDAELVALVPMDISSLDNDFEEELEGCRFIRDEIVSECIEGCPSRTVNDDDLVIRVEIMDEDVSIFSSLSSSDDDDDFHQASPEIQDDSCMNALGSVAGGVQVTTVKGSNNRSPFDKIELLGYDDCAEHEPLSLILCGCSHSSHGFPMTNLGGEGKDSRCVRSIDTFIAKKEMVGVFVTPFQNLPKDKTQDVEEDSLERSIAGSIASIPIVLSQVLVTVGQDPLEDRESVTNDSFDLSPAGSSLGGGVRIQPSKTSTC